MVFPTRDEIRKALLLALADGASHRSDDVEVAVAEILGLSDSQRGARAGNGTRLGNEIDWIKGAGDMDLGLFERVGPKLYRLTPYGRSAAAGDIDPDATRTIHGRVSSPPTDLEERLDEDAETLRHDPNNIAALNRTARRYLERGETVKAIETFDRVLAIDPRNTIAAGRLRRPRRCPLPHGEHPLRSNQGAEENRHARGGRERDSAVRLPTTLPATSDLQGAPVV